MISFRVLGSKIQLMGWSSYSVLLWSLKASLLVFYNTPIPADNSEDTNSPHRQA